MVEKGILSNDQREEVLKIQRANLKKPHGYDPVRMLADIIFGRLAVKFSYLNQKQVNECVRIQASKHTAGQDCRLGELAVEKGYCSISDVLDILSLQGVTVMACSECDNQTNVFYYSPIKDYRCVVCGGKLVPLKEYSSED